MVEKQASWHNTEGEYNEIGKLITSSMDILQNQFTIGPVERYITTIGKGLNDTGQGHYFSEWSPEGQQFIRNEFQHQWQLENSPPSRPMRETAQLFTNENSHITCTYRARDIKNIDVQMWPCVCTNDAIMPINNQDLVKFINNGNDVDCVSSFNKGCTDTLKSAPIFSSSDVDQDNIENEEANGHNNRTNQIDHETQNVSATENQSEKAPIDIRMMPCIVTPSFVSLLSPEDILDLVGSQIESVSSSDQKNELGVHITVQLPNATIPRFKAFYESSEQPRSPASEPFNKQKSKLDISFSQRSSEPRILTQDYLRMEEVFNTPSVTNSEDPDTKRSQGSEVSNFTFTQQQRPPNIADPDVPHFRHQPVSLRTTADSKHFPHKTDQNLIHKTIVDNYNRHRCATPVPWLTVEENDNLRKSKNTNQWSTSLVPWITNVKSSSEVRNGFRYPAKVSKYNFKLKEKCCSEKSNSTESFVSIADEFENRSSCLEPFHVSHKGSSPDKHSPEHQLRKQQTSGNEDSDLEITALYSQKQYTELTNVSKYRASTDSNEEIETSTFSELKYLQDNTTSSMELFNGCHVSRNNMIALDQDVYLGSPMLLEGIEEVETEELSKGGFMSNEETESNPSLEGSQCYGLLGRELSSDEQNRPSVSYVDDSYVQRDLTSPTNIHRDPVDTSSSGYGIFQIFKSDVDAQTDYSLEDSSSYGSFISEICSGEPLPPSFRSNDDSEEKTAMPGQSPANICGTSFSGVAPFHIFWGETELIQARPITQFAGENSKLASVVNSNIYLGTNRCYYSYGDKGTKMIPKVPQAVIVDNLSLYNVTSLPERRKKRLSKYKTNQIYPSSTKLLQICKKVKKN